VTAAQYAIEV